MATERARKAAKKAAPRKAPAKKAAPAPPADSAAEIVAGVAAETPAELEVTDPAYEAHRLRLSGKSWTEVARQTGFETPQNAMAAVNVYLQRAALDQAFELGQLALTQELARLDELQDRWWSMATLGDKDAAKIVLDVMKQRARLLRLDRSDKVTSSQTIVITSTEDMAAELRRIATQGSALPPAEGSAT